MNWIVFALSAAFFMALYQVFLKLSSGGIHPILGALILQVVAALAGLAAVFFLKIKGIPLPVSNRGIAFAALAGLSVGLAEILSYYSFSQGALATRAVPVIIGGAIAFAALIGLLFMRESLSPIQMLGVALVVAGVTLLSR